MFKPLLRTIPSLSGNFTVGCKINEIERISSNDYNAYVREGCLMPLQNSLFTKNIELNLVKDQYEYSIRKFYNAYANMFYKENYSYDKKNFIELDDYEVNKVNNGRNKDYEFGCKRIFYSQQNYQFNFYAPFYIDDLDDLPEYFILNIRLNNNLEKHIKIYINKEHTLNYLRSYLVKYVKHLDDKVIFCLPDSKQAAYFGIDVKNGGLVRYIDNVFGNLYNNQNTINNFDYMICNGFERNNLIMKQIIPLSFLININDIFNYHERKFFSFWKLQITGYYYDKDDIRQDFYDFSIDYSDLHLKHLKYNENTGVYEYEYGYESNGDKINIMNVGFPSLNESKYTKYRFTNKITPNYCRFKLANSLDDDPYIINMSYAFSYIETPSNKYGNFPTMFKDIYPLAIVKNNNMCLPVGNSKYENYSSNNANLEKYVKLMSNFYSSWFNIYYEDTDIFKDTTLWANVNNDYSYFRGVLYKADKDSIGEHIDRFGIFLNIDVNYIENDAALNNIVGTKYILTSEFKNNAITIDQFQFDSNICKNITYKFDINGSLVIDSLENKTPLRYKLDASYNDKTLFSVNNITADLDSLANENSYVSFTSGNTNHKVMTYTSNLYKSSTSVKSYLLYNEKMKKDKYGSYILIDNYYKENKYYNLKEVKKIIINHIGQNRYNLEDIENEINKYRIKGYEKIDVYNPINLYDIYYTNDNVQHHRSITETADFVNNEWYKDNPWYISSSFSSDKIPVSDIYTKIKDNIDYYNNFRVYTGFDFISEADLMYFLNSVKMNKGVWKTTWHPSDINRQFTKIDTLNNIFDEANQKLLNIYGDSENDEVINRYNDFKNETINHLSRYQKCVYFNNVPLLPVVYDEIVKLQTYNLCPYEYDNGIKLTNFFIKNQINKDRHVYVDTYDLNKYISLYNKGKENKIPYLRTDKNDSYIRKYFFSRIIDKTHIVQYLEHLIKTENAFSEDGIDTNNIKFSLLDNLYIKERIWYINSSGKIDIKDRYIQLYEYIKWLLENPKYSSCRYLNQLYQLRRYAREYNKANEFLIDMIELKRNTNDKFILYLDSNKTIEIDLVFYKEFIQLNEDLYNMMYNDDRCYLYLYTRNQYKENKDTWKIHYKNKTDNNCARVSSIKEIDDFLMPLFTNVYINNSDVENIYSMIHNNKIYIDRYIDNDNYFKEIDVDSYVFELSTESSLNNALSEIGEETYETFDNQSKHEAINKIKENDKYYHETYIPSLGINLYSIYNISNIEYNDDLNISDNYTYHKGKDNLINIVTDENGIKFGFYLINIMIDNTNNTFNINNSFDISTAFKYIDGKNILTGKSEDSSILPVFHKNDYIKSIFRILNPFLKINIFKEFVTDIKNIVIFPNETDMTINYMPSQINPDDEYKYLMLKDKDSDVLYDNIIRNNKERRIKLLRYFSHISPLIQKRNIIENVWENKYIRKEINTNVEKYNILYKTDINIYKYNPIYVVTEYDFVNHKEISSDFESQYEYKHFNDNELYNLEEEFTISLKDIIDYDQLVNEYETEEKTLEIFRKYVNKVTKKQLNINIILFLFNKYNVSYLSEIHKLNSEKTKKLYKISYKFNLK